MTGLVITLVALAAFLAAIGWIGFGRIGSTDIIDRDVERARDELAAMRSRRRAGE
ncbi:hypothetical protein IU438_22460 [Nocardia cyriacigeorgica]|jgi:hypothetical protein|uniref:hypothetical protein n=1 Tax=Nocardia cyriacigeorgica TaxID=135487 RepID=UPI0002FFBBCC|nr:hypothetical protein [Nocardia cyriacigeorgica]MBF6088864.1 hypothetical protein [Nocardia cyriacigeorgica]MBF6093454.1 hypothetical protein [Nocardia cyriacigeorgica]MBF6098344.1 hypothetical protein [Nocardia cyriacigeorgica]MBF6157612.1 hypothetical protein [Nocardia cyriacigeorgica]MBF6196583.1 hypothetical protein [Nocardia cyriacigeorgica]